LKLKQKLKIKKKKRRKKKRKEAKLKKRQTCEPHTYNKYIRRKGVKEKEIWLDRLFKKNLFFIFQDFHKLSSHMREKKKSKTKNIIFTISKTATVMHTLEAIQMRHWCIEYRLERQKANTVFDA
jgi:hypothetical protein